MAENDIYYLDVGAAKIKRNGKYEIPIHALVGESLDSALTQIQDKADGINEDLQKNYPKWPEVAQEQADLRRDVGKLEENLSKISPVVNSTERRVTNLEYALEGKAYRTEELEGEAYTRDIPADAMPYGTLDYIGGKSLVCNQISNMAFGTSNGIEKTMNDDGTINIHGTAIGSYPYNQFGITELFDLIRDGRKYLIISNTVVNKKWGISGYGASFSEESTRGIFSSDVGGVWRGSVFLQTFSGDTYNLYNVRFCVIDLSKTSYPDITSITDPRVDVLESIVFSKPEITEPTIVNADSKAVVSKSRNLLEEQFEIGSISSSTGEITPNATAIRSKNYIAIDGGKPIIAGDLTKVGFYIYQYDANRKFLAVSLRNSANGWTQTLRDNTRYIKITKNNTTIYKNNLYILYGNQDTGYVPYFYSYAELSTIVSKYFPDGMKSAGTVHDVFDIENGVAVTKIGSVYIGLLDVRNDSTGFIVEKFKTIYNAKYPMRECLNAVFINNSAWSNHMSSDISIHLDSNTHLYIRHIDYDNLQAFKTAMSNVQLLFELDEPTTQPIDSEDIAALRYIATEAGGTITFENTLDGLHIPVPNKETLLIKTGGAI